MRPLPLHERHAARNARFSDVGGAEVVSAFGPVSDEYQAARTSAVLVDRSYRELLRVTGEDRVSFLHGMVTNDVQGLSAGQTTYAALLTAKGAMVADARLWRREEDVLLDVEPGHGAKVRDALDKYLISEDAELHDATGEFGLLSLFGPRAGEVVSPVAVGRFEARELAGAQVWVTGSALTGLPGVDVLVPVAQLGAVYEALLRAGDGVGLREAGFEALEILRVEAGVPRYAADMDDKTIPLEANLEHALHYKKGCYIGQEVIARATFRGHMNRKLMGLALQSPPSAPRAELRVGDRRVGWITSVVQSPQRGLIALGYVHRDFLSPGTQLEVADGSAPVTVTPLPFA